MNLKTCTQQITERSSTNLKPFPEYVPITNNLKTIVTLLHDFKMITPEIEEYSNSEQVQQCGCSLSLHDRYSSYKKIKKIDL